MEKRKTLLRELIDLKDKRKNYYIKPEIKFTIDRDYYTMLLLPTVIVEPWFYRTPLLPIVDIAFLNFHITFGKRCVK